MDLLIDGIWLMAVGLTIVFAFLMILVGLLVLMSKAVARWGPEELLPASPSVAAPAALPAGDERLVAVIAAAIRTHRRRHRH